MVIFPDPSRLSDQTRSDKKGESGSSFLVNDRCQLTQIKFSNKVFLKIKSLKKKKTHAKGVLWSSCSPRYLVMGRPLGPTDWGKQPGMYSGGGPSRASISAVSSVTQDCRVQRMECSKGDCTASSAKESKKRLDTKANSYQHWTGEKLCIFLNSIKWQLRKQWIKMSKSCVQWENIQLWCLLGISNDILKTIKGK